MSAWPEHERRERGRYEDGLARLPDAGDARQKQLVRMANAAYGAGLACLMDGRDADAARWLERSAERYRESYEDGSGSWGRLVAVLKARLLGGEEPGDDARWALAQGAEDAESQIGWYAAALALLALGEGERAAPLAERLRRAEFPGSVADALRGLASGDARGYAAGLEETLRSFEERESFLEGVRVADTVLALEALAEPRGLAVRPASPVLP